MITKHWIQFKQNVMHSIQVYGPQSTDECLEPILEPRKCGRNSCQSRSRQIFRKSEGEFNSTNLILVFRYRQRWQASDVPAELAKRVICACIREICYFRDFMGLKRQKFSWSRLARHLYLRQLACEPQTGSLAYFSRTEQKNPTSSLD